MPNDTEGTTAVARPRTRATVLVHRWRGGRGAELTANLAVYLGWQVRALPLRVLVVSIDGTGALALPPRSDRNRDLSPARASRQPSPNPLDDVSHRPDLNLDVVEVPARTGRRLRAVLEAASPVYDYVLVDVPAADSTHPSSSSAAALRVALRAADSVLVSAATSPGGPGPTNTMQQGLRLALALADTMQQAPPRASSRFNLALALCETASSRTAPAPRRGTPAARGLSEMFEDRAAVVVVPAASSGALAVTRNDTATNTACFALLRSLLPDAPLVEANPAPLRRAARQALLARLRNRPAASPA